MSVLDLDRLKTIAAFLRSQIGIAQKPVGLVQLNDEEAGVVVEALEEYVLREMALGDARHAEWDQLRGFYRRHALPPKRTPLCMVCRREPSVVPPRIAPRELPGVMVCDVCRAKALTSDIAIRCDSAGRAVRVERVNEYDEPIGIIWAFAPIRREERLYDPPGN